MKFREVDQLPGVGHARNAVAGFREAEKRDALPPAHVEEEVLAESAWQIDGPDKFKAQDVRVEVDRALHVFANERDVIESANFEFYEQCFLID